MATRLQIYREPFTDPDARDADPLPAPTVSVRLRDLLPLVAMAQKLNFLWLKDFLDDEVRVTDDLHELLLTLHAGKSGA